MRLFLSDVSLGNVTLHRELHVACVIGLQQRAACGLMPNF
jgi:hypothetical protein